MGWMTWNLFQGNISEELIKETADAMVENGFRDAGYEYIFIDDLWQGGPSSDLGGVGCNYTEYQTQMSMWCMMSSVLALSNHWQMVLMPLLFLTAAIKPSIYRLISSSWD